MRPTAPRGPIIVALVVVLAAAVGPAVAAAAVSTPTDGDLEGPGTTMRIALQPDGDARWTVTVRFALGSANETRAFDRLAAEFEAGGSDALSTEPFREAARLAEVSTGRTMAIEGVSRTTGRGNAIGRLSLSFTWTNFSRTAGDRIELGDAFVTGSGTWLPELGADQELIVVFPEGYEVQSSSRPIRNGTFHIEGPARFEPGRPSAVLVRGVVTTTTTGTPTPGDTPDTPSPTAGIGPVLGIGAALAVGGLITYLFWRGRRDEPETPGAAADGSPALPPDGGTGAEELLSDEERVLRLLEDRDGRMKQAAIVEETDWSNAKVSQLLSEMDERGLIEKLRIGRENLISLPDDTPDGVG